MDNNDLRLFNPPASNDTNDPIMTPVNLMEPPAQRDRFYQSPEQIRAGLMMDPPVEANPPLDPINIAAGFGSGLVKSGVKTALGILPGMMASEVPIGVGLEKLQDVSGNNPYINTVAGIALPLLAGKFLEPHVNRAAGMMANDLVRGGNRGSIEVGMLTPGSSYFAEKWGGDVPKAIEFKPIENMPEVRGFEQTQSPAFQNKILPEGQAFHKKYGENPAIREASALYTADKIGVTELEQMFNNSFNRDEAGQTIFEKLQGVEGKRRFFDQLNRAKNKRFATSQKNNIGKSASAGRNMKVAGSEIVIGDTSKGCLGNCPECYMNYGQSGMNKATCDPVAVELTGHFSDNPEAIRRIGENGEPNLDPRLWEANREVALAKLKANPNLTNDDLDGLISQNYDWSWTNEQLDKTGLSSAGSWVLGTQGQPVYLPGGRDKTFMITKLQSLKGFDPNKIRNLEVSIDPTNPSHAFKAMKNVEFLKLNHPEVNISLRVRSIASSSDEINAIQKAAVDMANKYNLDVLETRMRFKNKDTFAMTMPLNDYYYSGNQYKHLSYFPSREPVVGPAKYPEGRGRSKPAVKEVSFHTMNGEQPSLAGTMVGTLKKKGALSLKEKQSQGWDILGPEGEVESSVKGGMEGKSEAERLAKIYGDSVVDSKALIADIARGESPLARFGIKPSNLHACNTFNMGATACSQCRECNRFIEKGIDKAYDHLIP